MIWFEYMLHLDDAEKLREFLRKYANASLDWGRGNRIVLHAPYDRGDMPGVILAKQFLYFRPDLIHAQKRDGTTAMDMAARNGMWHLHRYLKSRR